jgi:hypothetical protein
MELMQELMERDELLAITMDEPEENEEAIAMAELGTFIAQSGGITTDGSRLRILVLTPQDTNFKIVETPNEKSIIH